MLRRLLAHQATWPPPSRNVKAKFAVSEVTCKHADMRRPSNGRSLANRFLMSSRTGMSLAAHSILDTPWSARFKSLTSPGVLFVFNFPPVILCFAELFLRRYFNIYIGIKFRYCSEVCVPFLDVFLG